MKCVIYTDGSCKGNGKTNNNGGWAYVILLGDEAEASYSDCGFESNTTNQKMEMTAVINALAAASQLPAEFDSIEVRTDSAYIVNCYVQKWYKKWGANGWMTTDRKPVRNRELWMQLVPYFENGKYTFTKVQGHAYDQWNNYVDQLATGGKQ